MESLNTLKRNMLGISNKRNICRSLFGEVDHEENKRYLDQELKTTLQQKMDYWNFDFEKYRPRNENKSGLQWIQEPLTAETFREKTLKQRPICIAKDTNNPIANSTMRARNISSLENKQTHITDFTQKINTTDDESNVIEIINESPTRNIRITRFSSNTKTDSSKKLNILDQEEGEEESTEKQKFGKRKRYSQPTIDDFMKKKKPRMNMELSLKSTKPTPPISSRLRSSPAVKLPL